MTSTKEINEQKSIYLLYRVNRLLRQNNADLMLRADVRLSPEQWRILRQLATSGPLHLNELADPHLDDRPNITRLVEALVRQGLVKRSTDPKDRRKKLVQITARGEDLTCGMIDTLKSVNSHVFQDIDPEDTARLLNILYQLEHNLTKERNHDH